MPKLTIEFGENLAHKITKLAEKKGVSRTTILRRAVVLYEYALNQVTKDSAKKLSITKDNKVQHDILI